jgi:hypothetical protein
VKQREFEQIETAIKMAHGYNINGLLYIPAQNFLALLAQYVETDESPAPVNNEKDATTQCPACKGTTFIPKSAVGEGEEAHACRMCSGKVVTAEQFLEKAKAAMNGPTLGAVEKDIAAAMAEAWAKAAETERREIKEALEKVFDERGWHERYYAGISKAISVIDARD